MNAPHISRPTLGFFRVIARVWFQLHFRSVLTLNTAPFKAASVTSPLIVYGNHSSWWDPMIAVLLAAKLMPGRQHFAPMDASSLRHNRLLRQIGIFPVEMHSGRGAAQFLRTSMAILRENGVVWITPQGRFADTREQPLSFRPGLAALAARFPAGCTLLPLATEYVYWNERLPQALAHFGQPVTATSTAELERALAQTMDELKAASVTRDRSNFTRLPLWSKVRA